MVMYDVCATQKPVKLINYEF